MTKVVVILVTTMWGDNVCGCFNKIKRIRYKCMTWWMDISQSNCMNAAVREWIQTIFMCNPIWSGYTCRIKTNSNSNWTQHWIHSNGTKLAAAAPNESNTAAASNETNTHSNGSCCAMFELIDGSCCARFALDDGCCCALFELDDSGW